MIEDIDLKSFEPDLYLRYSIVFETIKTLRGSQETSIIDVGGRSGLLGYFIKKYKLQYHLTVVDLRKDVYKNPTLCDSYVQGDIFTIPAKNYDIVVSIDTLEHVSDKKVFIKKLLMFEGIIIIAAPFKSNEVTYAEKNVNEFFKHYTHKNHPWLSEHTKYGLPDLNDIKHLVNDLKLHVQEINSNNVNNWVQFMCLNLVPVFLPNSKVNVDQFNRFYNDNFQKLGDSLSPSYRKILIISRAKLTPLLFPEVAIDTKLQYVSQIKIAMAYATSSLTLQNNVELEKQELARWRQHASNLDTILRQILKSKVFRIWQLFKKLQSKPLLLLKLPILLFERRIYSLFKYSDDCFALRNNLIKLNSQYSQYLLNHKNEISVFKNQQGKSVNFGYQPIISLILPVYNPDLDLLEKCLKSVINQTYKRWQLCIADDASSNQAVKIFLNKYKNIDSRISLVFRSTNGHISVASNTALELAIGEFVGFIDQDDVLTSNALYEVTKIINENNSKVDVVYSDEDKIELNGIRTEPFFKPDWSPDLLLSLNYFTHFTVIRKSLLTSINGFRPGFEGSQDYDLFLRITELTKNIFHIPKILYTWRKTANSTAQIYSAKPYADKTAIKAIKDSLIRRNISASVEKGLVEGTFRVKYDIVDHPLISIIIPTLNHAETLKRCIDSIISKTTYKNYQIIIVDTGSDEKNAKQLLNILSDSSMIKILHWHKPFNYSAVNNFAATEAKGEYLIFLNNDTEVITNNWIESLLEHAQRDSVGAVGAKLLYPNGKIQHAGIVLGIKGGNIKRGVAGHLFKNNDDVSMGYAMGNLKDVIRDCAAVTAACLMIKKDKYFSVGGFDEKLVIAFNDVDLNLKLLKMGFNNVYTPYVRLYHHESISVGTPQQGNRDLNQFALEIKTMLKRWDLILENDPYYNPNLSLQNENCEIKV